VHAEYDLRSDRQLCIVRGDDALFCLMYVHSLGVTAEPCQSSCQLHQPVRHVDHFVGAQLQRRRRQSRRQGGDSVFSEHQGDDIRRDCSDRV